MRIFSYGVGVQSTAALVLAARGELEVDTFLFANVGEDSEHPATLRYVHEVALPYAERCGVPLIELHKVRRDGTRDTLYGGLMQPHTRSITIPVRMRNGAPGNRTCTVDFKIRVIAKWCRQHGATAQDPAVTMLGISLDEFQRMRTDSGIAYTRLAYPLVERRMSRQDCRHVIASAGLPVPPKSSCWFCPFHSLRVWSEMRDREPELFARAAALEQQINAKRARLGRDAVWLTRRGKPLAQAVGSGVQPALFDDEADACESGFCLV